MSTIRVSFIKQSRLFFFLLRFALFNVKSTEKNIWNWPVVTATQWWKIISTASDLHGRYSFHISVIVLSCSASIILWVKIPRLLKDLGKLEKEKVKTKMFFLQKGEFSAWNIWSKKMKFGTDILILPKKSMFFCYHKQQKCIWLFHCSSRDKGSSQQRKRDALFRKSKE